MLRVACFALVISTLFGCASTAFAAEPVKHIGIYVQPYYEAPRDPEGHPRVAVYKRIDGLLASNARADIVAARDVVSANAKLTTPMAMMVLAIRLYDVGLRDDSVFWFYAAKDRYIAFAEVIDVSAAELSEVDAAVKSFATLAGPFINGYAFCDLANQQKLRREALAWVESNPYETMFMTDLPARSGDRRANLQRAIEKAKVAAEKERAHFDDPKNVEAYYTTRKNNEMDVKFCWK
jgi:hypothetical protein